MTIRQPDFKQFEEAQLAGFTVIPLSGKKPRDSEWTTREYNPQITLAVIKRDKLNAGLRIPANVFVFDPDVADSQGNDGLESYTNLCLDLGFDDSDFHRVRTGSGGKHVYGTIPSGFKTRTKFDGYGGVQVRRKGNQTVLPGSKHPETGELYEFEADSPRWDTPLRPFPKCVLDLIAAPDKPEREHVEGGVYSVEQVAAMLAQIDPADVSDYDTWLQIGMACKHANEESREVFLDWCERDSNYTDKREENEAKWETFNGEGVSFRTLEWHVHKAGGDLAQVDFADAPPIEPKQDEAATQEKKAKLLARFKAVSLSTVMAAPDPKWLIEGVLTENALFEVFGQFKAGKTFFGLEMGLAIGTGLEFFDAKTTKGKVIYVIAEGNRKLFGYRVEAWITERAQGNAKLYAKLKADVEANFLIVSVPVHMDQPKAVLAFLEANPGKYAAVFIDTLMRNMTGDPMKPADMIRFMAGCDTIRSKTGGAVVFFHHMRRENGTGGYGPIIGEAFVDGAAIVFKKGKERRFKLHVMRDGDDSAPSWNCELQSRNVLLSMNEDGGDERTTAVLVFTGRGGLSADDRILLAIKRATSNSIPELETESGVPKRTITRRLKELRKAGLVANDVLRLTAEGSDAADLVEGDDND